MSGDIPAGRRLTKRDVEALLADYDTDPRAALAAALAVAVGRPGLGFADAVAAAIADPHERAALLADDPATGATGALDALARRLNEQRRP